MNDLISRQMAIDAMISQNGVVDKSVAKRILIQLPSEESKKGKWLPHPGYRDWDVCSACGIGCKRREYGLMPYGAKEWMTEYSYQYCPNCGAKMEVSE